MQIGGTREHVAHCTGENQPHKKNPAWEAGYGLLLLSRIRFLR